MPINVTDDKDRLHELVDRLAPSQVHAAYGLLQAMLDPVWRAIASAPVDEGPLTAEETHALQETTRDRFPAGTTARRSAAGGLPRG